MDEITFQVQRDEESGWLVASWDALDGSGGITTQGKDLRELQEQIMDAVTVHFDGEQAPGRIRLHFISDPILLSA
jgi:predicted RNase H-like HicB family nuclease